MRFAHYLRRQVCTPAARPGSGWGGGAPAGLNQRRGGEHPPSRAPARRLAAAPRREPSEVTVAPVAAADFRSPAPPPCRGARRRAGDPRVARGGPARGPVHASRDREDLAFDRPEAWAMAWFADRDLSHHPRRRAAAAGRRRAVARGRLGAVASPRSSAPSASSATSPRTSTAPPPSAGRASPSACRAGLTATLSLDAAGRGRRRSSPTCSRCRSPGRSGRASDSHLVGAPAGTGRQSSTATSPARRTRAGSTDPDRNPYGCEQPSTRRAELPARRRRAAGGRPRSRRWPRLSPYAAVACEPPARRVPGRRAPQRLPRPHAPGDRRRLLVGHPRPVDRRRPPRAARRRALLHAARRRRPRRQGQGDRRPAQRAACCSAYRLR